MKEFTFLTAVCFPNLDTLKLVEHESRLLLNDYHFLRSQLRGSLRLGGGGGRIQRRGDRRASGAHKPSWGVGDESHEAAALRDACTVAFIGVDTDRSGTIDALEFEVLLSRLLGPNTTLETRRRIAYLFQVLNHSRDGCRQRAARVPHVWCDYGPLRGVCRWLHVSRGH